MRVFLSIKPANFAECANNAVDCIRWVEWDIEIKLPAGFKPTVDILASFAVPVRVNRVIIRSQSDMFDSGDSADKIKEVSGLTLILRIFPQHLCLLLSSPAGFLPGSCQLLR